MMKLAARMCIPACACVDLSKLEGTREWYFTGPSVTITHDSTGHPVDCVEHAIEIITALFSHHHPASLSVSAEELELKLFIAEHNLRLCEQAVFDLSKITVCLWIGVIGAGVAGFAYNPLILILEPFLLLPAFFCSGLLVIAMFTGGVHGTTEYICLYSEHPRRGGGEMLATPSTLPSLLATLICHGVKPSNMGNELENLT